MCVCVWGGGGERERRIFSRGTSPKRNHDYICVRVAPPLPTLQDDAGISNATKEKVIGYYEYLVRRTATTAH